MENVSRELHMAISDRLAVIADLTSRCNSLPVAKGPTRRKHGCLSPVDFGRVMRILPRATTDNAVCTLGLSGRYRKWARPEDILLRTTSDALHEQN
jgi:hypothetical protein